MAGFTLTEMIAVFAIIIFLVSLIIGVSKYANRAAKESAAQSEMQRIANVLQDHFVEQGRYPSSLTEIEDRLHDVLARWSGTTPLDPWRNPYRYGYAADAVYAYELFSMGPDGTNGTPESDADNINSSGR